MDATIDIFDDKRREFHLDRYRFAAKRVQGKQVLDCACGTGYGVRLLLEQGLASSVIGVDIDTQAIQYAWHHHNAGAAMFVCAPGDRLPFADASVDVITSLKPSNMCRTMSRWSKSFTEFCARAACSSYRRPINGRWRTRLIMYVSMTVHCS